MPETREAGRPDDLQALLAHYLDERIRPHPILSPCIAHAAVAAGAGSAGGWDEGSDLELKLVLSDEAHKVLAARLREAGLWDPARDRRLRLEDRESFRRFPGVELQILSTGQVRRELFFEPASALWVWANSAVLQDPLEVLAPEVARAEARFQALLPGLQCEHYYLFRRARTDLVPRVTPRRLSTLLAIKRGEAAREALRLAFLAVGRPYPPDRLLEPAAEEETRCGSGIVTAVRALLAAREVQTIEHTSKVLRDRVAFALQQGGVEESWLEQWWLWPETVAVPG